MTGEGDSKRVVLQFDQGRLGPCAAFDPVWRAIDLAARHAWAQSDETRTRPAAADNELQDPFPKSQNRFAKWETHEVVSCVLPFFLGRGAILSARPAPRAIAVPHYRRNYEYAVARGP